MKKTETFEEFQVMMAGRVQKKLDEKIKVEITEVTKNNGVVLKALTFHGREGISPTIYLEQFYDAYLEGAAPEVLTNRIVDTFLAGSGKEVFDINSFINYEEAKKHIVYKLVNYEKNQKLLEKVPYRKYLDMAVVYYYLLENDTLENASILIYNNHLDSWGISQEELDEVAVKNTPKLLKEDLRSITEVLEELMRGKGMDECLFQDPETEEEIGMYVLSNRNKIFGAAAILYKGVLKAFANKLGKDLFILPSSVHEVIILPKDGDSDWEKLREMVREVNATQVEEVEVLSDSVYWYSRKKNCLSCCG